MRNITSKILHDVSFVSNMFFVKPHENEEVHIFPSSAEDIYVVRDQKKSQRLYLELLRNGKFIEAQELWDKVIRHTFLVKELQIIF